jgi:hypothetical protein
MTFLVDTIEKDTLFGYPILVATEALSKHAATLSFTAYLPQHQLRQYMTIFPHCGMTS